MGPDWWITAWEACEEAYNQANAANAGPAWDELTDDQQGQAVADYLGMLGDMAGGEDG